MAESPRDRGRERAAGRGALARTVAAVRLTLARRDGRATAVLVAATFGLLYLVSTGRLVPGRGTVGAFVVADPLARLVERTTIGTFEPVARVDLGPVAYLFSPVDALVAGSLGALAGLNAGLSVVAWRAPAACGIDADGDDEGDGSEGGRATVGALAGAPALLSGTACCGPTLLLAFGVQATGALVAGFAALVPLSLALLVAGLVLAGRRVAPVRSPDAAAAAGGAPEG